MNVEYDLVIDFARPSKSNTIIISEGDSNSRLCRFVLLSNKQAFDMLDVSTATVKGIKSDGSVIYGDGTIAKDDYGNNINEVTYTLPAAVSDISGKTTMTITLMSVRGEVITSFEFYVQTRNSLYSEDDYISDSDLSGFRDLLNRSNAALEKMEQMTQAEALPNPYPLNVYTNKEEYHYSGAETVDIHLGDIAYLAEDPVYDVDLVDETAAGQAVKAADDAEKYAKAARESASSARTSKDDVETMALDIATHIAEASEAAVNASKSAVVATEQAEIATNAQKNINKTITDKVTTITTQLAGDMIDDIVDETRGYRDQAQTAASTAASETVASVTSSLQGYVDQANTSAINADNSANRAEQAASSVHPTDVEVTQISGTGVHIADISVDGVVTEIYAPAPETPASAASDIIFSNSTSGLDAENVQDAVDELTGLAKSSNKVLSNVTVSSWIADSTYSDYPYRATISVDGINSNYIPNVILGVEEATSGDYCPVAESGDGVVYIYSKTNKTITVPTIFCIKEI